MKTNESIEISGIMLKQVIEICEQHDAPIVVKDNVVIISLL